MSKTDLVLKSTSAVSTVLGAVDKFGATNEDGSPDALKIVSGVADIGNAIATFLPPPYSVVTGVVSSFLSMFGAGGPSTEQVVKEEFQKMKKFAAKLFAEQRKFIEEQTKFIAAKLEEQKRFIAEQTAII